MACCNTLTPTDTRWNDGTTETPSHPGATRAVDRRGLRRLERTDFRGRIEEIVSRTGDDTCVAHRAWLDCMRDVLDDIDYIGDEKVTSRGLQRYVGDEELTEWGGELYVGREKFAKWYGVVYLGDDKVSSAGRKHYIGDREIAPTTEAKRNS